MKQCQEIKENWSGQENLRKEDWVLGSVSYHFCDIPNIS